MKKLIYIFLFACCITSGKQAYSQLLKAGDAVVTMSGSLWTNNAPTSPNYVMEILHTRNTSGLSTGVGWSPMTSSAFSTFTYKHPDWIRSKLGNIFGITIDNNRNIYVAATGFYGSQLTGISTGQIWKIDAITGAATSFKDLHTSGQDPKGLGNIKVIGNFLYAANLADGKIYVIDITNPAANFTPFDPGGPSDTRKPYGLAIRNISGVTRLYYSLNEFNSSTTEIKSIEVNSSNFVGAEQSELSNFMTRLHPITDIAFSKDNQKMILAGRSVYGDGWGGSPSWTSTAAHRTTVWEYTFNNLAPIGNQWGIPSHGYAVIDGSAGGLDFSDAIITKNSQFKCDTTIWTTADHIHYGATYGIAGFNHKFGDGTSTGLAIDIDNDVTQYDKTYLGDVEICDTTINCPSACDCGEWGNGLPPMFGGTGNPLTLTVPQANGFNLAMLQNCGGSYSFIKDQVRGTLNVNYQCAGSCQAEINWQLKNLANNTTITSGSAINRVIELNQFNNLGCGSYKFIITPKCGTASCTPCEFNINVVCDPPPCCPPQTQISIQPGAATYTANNSPGMYGTYSQSFTLNANVPISEVRIDVEHFGINSKDPDCISCINKPKTWGSLLGAAYNGTGFVRPINSSPFLSSLYANGRELVYKPGSLITINNGVVNVNIGMPNKSPVDCCELTAEFCLKFTFKDANCKECVFYYCNTPVLKSATDQVIGRPVLINEVNKKVNKASF
jgi:hypothetical protein